MLALADRPATLEDALRSALGGSLRRPRRGVVKTAAGELHCLVCGEDVVRERTAWGDAIVTCTACGSSLEEPASAHLSLV